MIMLCIILGAAVGFVGSVPVTGPVSASVFSYLLEGRYRSGLWTAAGGSIAKGLYAGLAAWGLSSLLSDISWVESASHWLAALILCVIGLALLRHRTKPTPSARGLGFFFGLTVTLLNPTLLGTFGAVIAVLHGRGIAPETGLDCLAFGVSAGLGMVLWYCCAIALMKRFAPRLEGSRIRVAKRAMAVLVFGLALYLAISA